MKAKPQPLPTGAVDRFRAASAAARARNTRATFRAFDRGVAQGKAAGFGFMGTVTSKRDQTAYRRSVREMPKATGFDYSANRTARQQRSIDRTNAATRFYGLGTVSRGAKKREFGPGRRKAGYQAPRTRLF